jgi:hypothetical protein
MGWIAFFVKEKSKCPCTPAVLQTTEDVRAIYAALVTKRATYDLMLWQAPMISLTAQAFLLQIALGDDQIMGNKIVSGLAAFLVGLASWHLFKTSFRPRTPNVGQVS